MSEEMFAASVPFSRTCINDVIPSKAGVHFDLHSPLQVAELVPSFSRRMIERQETHKDQGSAMRGTFRALTLGTLLSVTPEGYCQQVDVQGPPGSGGFGSSITVLANGNVVVLDPGYSSDTAQGIGAAYLYGPDGSLISTLTGSSTNDSVGFNLFGRSVVVLENGNYLILSTQWNGQSGAVTWGSGTSGVSGVVSAGNSLIGSGADSVGQGVTPLKNGDYVVTSPFWNGFRGAATWGNGNTGTVGIVSPDNSLVGSKASDEISSEGVVTLTNGNYVVLSSVWNDGAGAATWGNGSVGTKGVVSAQNSLVGTQTEFGSFSVVALSNGNYVVGSPGWNGGYGAATWGNGSSGIAGSISSANSLVGSSSLEHAGFMLTALTNGNYVVGTPSWNENRGAITWGNGATGIAGTISPANSLLGSYPNDGLGNDRITALANGNYAVASSAWNGVGAVTWGDGVHGTKGSVTAANSLVGAASGDAVAYDGILALASGNYLVLSPQWNGASGALTWCDGGTGATTGLVSSANSLIGSRPNEFLGSWGSVAVLINGNYALANHMAVTWGDGTTGTHGTITDANSFIGGLSVIALDDGNFASSLWNDGYGGVTWMSGFHVSTGAASATNSLTGTSPGDHVGNYIYPVANGAYLVFSPDFHTADVAVGAVTLMRGKARFSDTVTALNSVIGEVADRGSTMSFGYDSSHDQLVVGRPAENKVSLLRINQLFKGAFDD